MSADREQEINRYDIDPGLNLYSVLAWINQVQAENGGVGIIISKVPSKIIINIKLVTNRIMIYNCQDNPILTTIVRHHVNTVTKQ